MSRSACAMICWIILCSPVCWALDAAVFLDPVKQDDAVLFREALRERGLTSWVEQFDADRPNPDQVELVMRRRASLLTEAAAVTLTDDERRPRLEQAHDILLQLIASQPDHRSRLYWLLESARDDLERLDPASFEAALVFELTGRDSARAAKHSDAAIKTLTELHNEVAAIWEATGKLEDAAIDQATDQGSLWFVEAIQQPAALLSAWARLCHATAADLPVAEQTEQFQKLLIEVTERRGWTQAEGVPVPRRAQALLMAAISARRVGQHDAARRYAQELIGLINAAPAAGQLGSLGLLAVLEQVRALRDAGRVNEAQQALTQARTWAAQTRKQDLPTELAICLAERTVMARGLVPADNSHSLFAAMEALGPLFNFMSASCAARDYAYRALAGALVGTAFDEQLQAQPLQLLVGAAVADLARASDDPQIVQRAGLAVAAAQTCMSSSAAIPADIRGELVYLVGRARYLQEQPVEAASALLTLAEQYPEHDRTPTALEQAVAVLGQQVFAAEADSPSQAWSLFVRTASTYRQRFPNSPLSAELAYQLGVALEHLGRFQEAEQAYAEVSADHAAMGIASLRRAHCLYQLSQARGGSPSSAPADLAGKVEQAARQAVERTRPPSGAAPADVCLHAEAIVLLADVLNRATAHPEEALELLDDFRGQYAHCAELQGPAQRERIEALLQLRRITAAREAIEEFVKTDPKLAGPVLAGLIEALQKEASILAEADDMRELRKLSEETAKLTASLLDWSREHPGNLSEADRLTIRIWRAQSLLNTDQPGPARELFAELSEATTQPSQDVAPTPAHTEVRLGLADSLRMLGQSREALPIYAGIYRTAEEESPFWWHALAGSLQCHTLLDSDPRAIVQAIRQRKHLTPGLGNAHWRRILEGLEQDNTTRAATQPAADPPSP